MRTSVELLQDSATLLDKVDTNLRIFSRMYDENSPDFLISESMLEELENFQDLVSRLICYYNSKN